MYMFVYTHTYTHIHTHTNLCFGQKEILTKLGSEKVWLLEILAQLRKTKRFTLWQWERSIEGISGIGHIWPTAGSKYQCINLPERLCIEKTVEGTHWLHKDAQEVVSLSPLVTRSKYLHREAPALPVAGNLSKHPWAQFQLYLYFPRSGLCRGPLFFICRFVLFPR